MCKCINKGEFKKLIEENNVSFEELSKVINFNFESLFNSTKPIPYNVVGKIDNYLKDDKGIDTFGAIYNEAPNPDGATNKEKTYTNYNTIGDLEYQNTKAELRSLGWRLKAADIMFSETKHRLNRILEKKAQYIEDREKGNIEFLLNHANSTWVPSVNDRFGINPLYLGTMTDDEMDSLIKHSGIPEFIYAKIKDGMLINFGAASYIYRGYKTTMNITDPISDFYIEYNVKTRMSITKDESDSNLEKIKKKRNYSSKKIPQYIVDNFARFKRYAISASLLSEITGIPTSTISRMFKNIKENGKFEIIPNPYEVITSIDKYEKENGKVFDKESKNKRSKEHIKPIPTNTKIEVTEVAKVNKTSNKIDKSIFNSLESDYLRELSKYLEYLASLKELEAKLF